MLRRQKPDIIIYNGLIYTMGRPPAVSALAISGTDILALGGDKEVLRLSRPGTRRINLRGLTVLPGFIDSHVHLYSYGLSILRLDLSKFPDIKSALAEIGRRSRSLKPDEWLLGRGWDKNYWGLDGFPHRKDLDPVCKNPCVFNSHDGHSVWVNSEVLKISGIDKNTKNPRGGVINKDASGEPTGILLEEAVGLIGDVVPEQALDEKLNALSAGQEAALKAGVTGVCDFDGDEDKYHLLQTALFNGKLKIKVQAAIRRNDFDRLSAIPLMSGLGNAYLRLGPLKLFADGALSTQTADMFQSYNGSADRGVSILGKNEMSDYIKFAESRGISCAIHAIGDRANYNVINSYLSNSNMYTPMLPRRIEHVQLIREQDLPSLKKTGAIASVQPSHLIADRDTAEKYWGKRCRHAYVFKSFLKHKIPLCFGSDAPLEVMDPIMGIYAAVNRHHPDDDRGPWYLEERLTVRQAVEGFTTGGAYAGGLTMETGRLLPGYFADMVVLSEDIFRVKKGEIHRAKVIATFSSGKPEYNPEKL